MKRYLITTADERTWIFDRPVLFLGQWCLRYDCKKTWSKMDYEVFDPYGLGQKNKDKDCDYTSVMEDELLSLLREKLNQIHSVEYTVLDWKIILGTWLRRYIRVVINRYSTLKNCIDSGKVDGVKVLFNDSFILAAKDSLSFVWACNDKLWNNVFYSKLFDYIPNHSIQTEPVAFEIEENGKTINEDSFSFKKYLRKKAYFLFDKLTNFFVRNRDGFVITSYLPIKLELLLQLRLFQAPKIWRSPEYLGQGVYDPLLRTNLKSEISKNKKDMESVIYDFLFDMLPICFLEGFKSVQSEIKNLPWPKRPKFIFTSNNFDFDELFKIWSVEKLRAGSKYYIGQHGNNYGTYRFNHPSIEESISDRFITWGWKDGLSQHTPAFLLKNGSRKPIRSNPNGKLLLIELPLFQTVETWDVYAEYSQYHDEQLAFVSGLGSDVKRELIIRLHKEYKYHEWCDEKRWKDFDPNLTLDYGLAPITSLISNSRLIVHSYDSTGMLETLSQNIPTIAFWANGLEHLRESAIPYYQRLVEVGIVHLSPKTAAEHINQIWNDVSTWWYSKNVQETRLSFCDRYAKEVQSPISTLREILLNESSKLESG
ncbi:LIC12162 family transferase [Leptospira noguchii]|uniref:Putative transferase, LIC12162 family n=1 Tax=Leptospira noguchii TaxID=28182 RepID=M6VKI1_9LEPT|nr:LIC12162 family protein [Leptospira noguchii]EMO53589.1 putative transferase, LIC12162 family [Leptospira noguchii]